LKRTKCNVNQPMRGETGQGTHERCLQGTSALKIKKRWGKSSRLKEGKGKSTNSSWLIERGGRGGNSKHVGGGGRQRQKSPAFLTLCLKQNEKAGERLGEKKEKKQAGVWPRHGGRRSFLKKSREFNPEGKGRKPQKKVSWWKWWSAGQM